MKPPRLANSWKRLHGFTLAEVMVAGGVTVIVMAICLTGFVALQRFQAVTLARSSLRTELTRLFDSLEVDLRTAKTVTAAVSGSENVFPLTLTAPQRYSTYVTAGFRAGDPSVSASRVQPTVNTTSGKLSAANNITIVYATVANGATAQNITRAVTWTNAGVSVTAKRVVATVPSSATVRFRSGGSTSASPSPIQTTDISLVVKASAPLTSVSKGTKSPTTMESAIFLRQKSVN